MSEIFLKDAQHGNHGGNNNIHLASCYGGPSSHKSDKATEILECARKELAHNAFSDPVYGNGAIQKLAREEIAKILKTDPANITLTINTNDGLHMVADGLRLSANSKVLMYQGEYPDVQTAGSDALENFSTGTFGENTPLLVRGARDSKDRPLGFDLAEIEALLAKNDVKLAMVSHVQFPNGFVSDLKNLSAICRKHTVPLVVDVAQSFGRLPIYPLELDVPALAGPLWKWTGGSLGTGFLYTSPEFRSTLKVARLSATGLDLPAYCTDLTLGTLREDGRRFETSTLPSGAWIRTSLMLKETADMGVENIAQEVSKIRALIVENLATPRIHLFSPCDSSQDSSIVAFTLTDPYAGREQEIVSQLWSAKQRVGITSRLGFIRVAPHHFTSNTAALSACKAIRDAVNAL